MTFEMFQPTWCRFRRPMHRKNCNRCDGCSTHESRSRPLVRVSRRSNTTSSNPTDEEYRTWSPACRSNGGSMKLRITSVGDRRDLRAGRSAASTSRRCAHGPRDTCPKRRPGRMAGSAGKSSKKSATTEYHAVFCERWPAWNTAFSVASPNGEPGWKTIWRPQTPARRTPWLSVCRSQKIRVRTSRAGETCLFPSFGIRGTFHNYRCRKWPQFL